MHPNFAGGKVASRCFAALSMTKHCVQDDKRQADTGISKRIGQSYKENSLQKQIKHRK
jgi:hypothetical protein